MIKDRRNNPKEFWNALSKKGNWKDYILPNRTDEEFQNEGKLEAQNIMQFAKNFGASFEYVIDYGCGIGRIANQFAGFGKLIGLDVCEEFVKKAGKGFYTIEEFKEDNVATFIYCISVIQHNDAENRKKIVDHIHSLLHKGGQCLINFPIRGEVYKQSWFVDTFTEEEITELFSEFSYIKMVKGNLANYGGRSVKNFNETFVIATK